MGPRTVATPSLSFPRRHKRTRATCLRLDTHERVRSRLDLTLSLHDPQKKAGKIGGMGVDELDGVPPTPGFKRFYGEERSLGYFTLDEDTVPGKIRRGCIKIVESPWFENIILAAILINTIILCTMEPLKMEGRGCEEGVRINYQGSPGNNRAVEDSEAFFTTLFTLEAVVKVVAMGFILDKTSYLKDGWNVMDFTVVIISIISAMPGMGNGVSSLRVIRVLRPLRAMSILPGMRVLIGTMIAAIPMIANVMLFCLFFFTVFGILGMNLYMGVLRNRCFTVVTESACVDHAEHESNEFCREIIPNFGEDRNVTAAVLLSDDSEQTCTNTSMSWPGYLCPAGMMCLKASNPNYGITHFDNIAHSWLTIFQCITLEGWTPIMYHAMDAVTGWSVIYFVLLVFTGGFFLLNLALAVITEVYDEENTEAKEDAAEEAAEKEAEADKREAEAAKRRKELGLDVVSEDDEDEVDHLKALDLGQAGPSPLKKLCQAIIEHRYFGPIFVVCIAVNTLVLAMEYDGMPNSYANALDVINLILTIMFILEMVSKVIGMGFEEYSKDRFNMFDATVVILSIVELALSAGGGLTALRAFRILRVLKLIRSWTSLQNFLYTIYLTVMELGNFTFIVVLTIFIFALLGMQLFGGKMCGLDDGDTPRHNFDTLIWALVTVFQVLTGEDWNAVMYDGMASNGSWSALYFVALLLIGNFVVLNLFVAILLTNFSEVEVQTEYESTKTLMESVSFFKYLSKKKGQREKTKEELEQQKFWDELPDKDFPPNVLRGWERLIEGVLHEAWLEETEAAEEEARKIAEADAIRQKRLEEEQAYKEGKMKALRAGKLVSFRYGLNATAEAAAGGCAPMPGAAPKPLHKYSDKKSLMIFGVDNPVRQFCFKLVDDKQFDYVIMTFILISSLTMAFESPKAMENSGTKNALEGVDIFFTIVFALEMVMKLIAFGLYLEDKDSYLRDPWNCMDGFIVMIGIVGKMISGNLGWVRSLRTMRVLRPLRVISRVPELKVVVNALFASIPGMGNVFMVSLLFWLIFGILGMQLFMGAFARCDDEDVEAKAECLDGWVNDTGVAMEWDSITKSCGPTPGGASYDHSAFTEVQCTDTFNSTVYVERTWQSDDMNFDNIFLAMQTLFEMSTTEGWTAVMYNGVDSRSPELAPKRDNNPPIAFFFVAFEIVANFFILNLFIGIILDNFARLAAESADGSNGLMTKAQVMWVKSQRRLQQQSIPAKADYYPEDETRKSVYKIVEREEFDWFIMAVIVCNALTMMMEHYEMNDTWTGTLLGLSILFAVIFTLEAGAKLYAMYPEAYFSSRWNCFDFFCVAITLVGFMAGSGGAASVFRILRLARIFRVVKKLTGLRMLFNTLIISLPGLLNIGALMFLLCFVYAILGMNLFGKVRFGDNLNKDANFTNFGNSLLLLLRMVTGEAWNSVMYDCMIDTDCDSDVDCARGECCGNDGAPFYFITFVILGTFITLNLLIAVVLDNFSNNKKEEGTNITDKHIEDFAEAWSRLDPHATGFIPCTRLVSILKLTNTPLGVKGTRLSRLGILRFQKNLNLHVESNYLHYQDVLQAVTARAMGINTDALPPDVQIALETGKVKAKIEAEKKIAENAKVRGSTAPMLQITHGMTGADGEQLTIEQLYAVQRIQAAFRGRKARREAQVKAEEDRAARSKAKAEMILSHVKNIFVEVEENERRRRGGALGRRPGATDSAMVVLRDSAQGSEIEELDNDSARRSPGSSI